MKHVKKVWIAWEKQRRTIELAQALHCELKIIESPSVLKIFSSLRYFCLGVRTINFLLYSKPTLVICQNPSLVLAALLSFLKKIFSFRLIVDRHSNFKPGTEKSKIIKWRLFHFLSKYSIRQADLTIVTNETLRILVDGLGGNGFVLQDKIPNLKFVKTCTSMRSVDYAVNEGYKIITFICTYSDDEPFFEVLESATLIPSKWMIFVTGNNEKISESLDLPVNVRLTGFLSEQDYVNLLYYSDLIIVLTNNENTLNCGAYEAMSVRKPCIVSDTLAIKEYFRKGFVYTKNDPESISRAICFAMTNLSSLSSQMEEFRVVIEDEWRRKFQVLQRMIDSYHGAHSAD